MDATGVNSFDVLADGQGKDDFRSSLAVIMNKELGWDFQSAHHTALFGPPEPETSLETPNPFLSAALPSNIQFLFTPEGVGEVVKLHLPFPTLDNGTLVDQQLTFLVVNPDYGKVLEFSPPPAYSGMTPKGTANVFADSDGFLGTV
ncbi:hypothetical protein AVEN_155855-1 [Araneus ventricosus]|uniref:Uncharacterized protein n=1 Tax=Araneus ventricosus TaxID=182803 RepID=A0A4Y2NBN3_ARAVE|nr:hypothetical protein AVEN_155855-1 [Araneus ventricosus]